LLAKYNPMREINFFKVILEKLKSSGYNILKFVAYGNFDDPDLKGYSQTDIQLFGIETKHCSNDGKSSVDVQLTVDTMTDLYRNENIDVFMVIASDRDYIPLIKAINLENKVSFAVTTKVHSNPVILSFAHQHQYIEDIFEFEANGISLRSSEEVGKEDSPIGVNEESITDELANKAFIVAQYLFRSPLWRTYKEGSGNKVGLYGFADTLRKNKLKTEVKSDIIHYLHVAHTLKFLTLVRDEHGMIYFEVGDDTDKVIGCR
ncbi:NYN domain-containing protein, partial [Brevibacillus borstelensis]